MTKKVFKGFAQYHYEAADLHWFGVELDDAKPGDYPEPLRDGDRINIFAENKTSIIAGIYHVNGTDVDHAFVQGKNGKVGYAILRYYFENKLYSIEVEREDTPPVLEKTFDTGNLVLMIALYPGSFDPITRGHLDVIRRTLVFCPQLIITIGSNIAKQNLFTAEERMAMIHEALGTSFSTTELSRITVTQFSGAVIHYASEIGATLIVKGLRGQPDYFHEEKMAVVNRRLSGEIDTVFLMSENDLRDVSSSAVREMARIGVAPEKLDHYLTPAVRDALLARIKN